MSITTELVNALLTRLGAGDGTGAAALFSDRVDFAIPHDPAVWWIPEVQTRADLAGFFDSLGAELEAESFDVEQIVVDGDNAVVLGRMVDVVRRTGKRFSSRFALATSQRDGQLTKYYFLEDTAAVRLAATDIS